MGKQIRYLTSAAFLLAASSSSSFAAGPSAADLEKALSACPPGQSISEAGLCGPSQGDQMGFDYTSPAYSGRHPGEITVGIVDLHMSFPKGAATLTDTDKAIADTVATVLLEPHFANRLVEISAYTSAQGDAAADSRLALQRANAVKAYLVHKGVPAARIRPKGHGAATEAAGGSDASDAGSERVVLTLIGLSSS